MTLSRALIVDNSKLSQTITCSLLNELEVEYDLVDSEASTWNAIKQSASPYDLVLVSRALLTKNLKLFVSRFRALEHYNFTPLILLLNDKGSEGSLASLYATGFTQIFSRKEFNLLRGYILQIQSRNTFKEYRENKVLIIEDDPSQQVVIRTILEQHHCQCFCFSSAEEALAQSASVLPDTITCDFHLDGDMTALDFLCRIRTVSHPWTNTPVLVITGLEDATRKYELVRSGANDYLSKPIDSLDLSVHVESLIRYKHMVDVVQAQKKEMQHLALHDQLTGVYNRHFVAQQVDISLINARRHGIAYSIIMLDIDFFKKINDEFGHDVGDIVLKAVATLLKENMRGDDVVARIGGEEFLVLMNHCDLQQGIVKAEAIRKKIESLSPHNIDVTASFGVAQLDHTMDCFDALYKSADEAVYRSKNLGRNRVESATYHHSLIANK